MGKPVPKTKKTDLPRRSAIWPLRSLAVVRKSVSHVKDGVDTASAAPQFTLIIHHSAEFVNSFRAFCRKNYRRYGAKNLGRLYSGENKRTNCCLSVCLSIAFPSHSKGVQGAKPPHKRTGGGRCRRGERPLTRGGSRKKIGYNEKHTERENC